MADNKNNHNSPPHDDPQGEIDQSAATPDERRQADESPDAAAKGPLNDPGVFEESGDEATHVQGAGDNEDAATQAIGGGQAGGQAGEAKGQTGQGQLAQERDELETKLKRVAADYENYRRRVERNAAATRDQQAMEFARGLVSVLDHFDRSLEVDPDKTTTQDVLDGVVMVRNELLRALQRFGVERMDVEAGEPFDPNRHEALMRQPGAGIEPGHVTAQLQPGYVLGDKPIRPAQVSVAE